MTENNNLPMPEVKNEDERDFKGIWIPKEVYLNTELSWTEKICLIEITSLDNNKNKFNGCFASNEYLAKFLNISSDRVSKIIARLKSLGFIHQQSFNGRVRILKSNLASLFLPMQSSRKQLGSIVKNNEYINIVNNTITTPPPSLPFGRSNTPDLQSETQNTPPSGKESKDSGNLKVTKRHQPDLAQYYTPSGNKEKKLLKLLNSPDYKIIEQLQEVFDNHELAEELDCIIDKILTTKGVPKKIREKIRHLSEILQKSEKNSLLNGISIIKQRNKSNSLSYLNKTIQRNQGLYKKHKEHSNMK